MSAYVVNSVHVARLDELLGPMPGRGHQTYTSRGIGPSRSHEFRLLAQYRPAWEIDA